MGQVARETKSYRQGLVLGFTVAEAVLLIIFCLLMAMAAFLRSEHTRFKVENEKLKDEINAERKANDISQTFGKDLNSHPELYEMYQKARASGDDTTIDEFWRDLAVGKRIADQLIVDNVQPNDAINGLRVITQMQGQGLTEKDILADTTLLNDAWRSLDDSVGKGAFQRRFSEAIEGVAGRGGSGEHNWPPIITLSESNGFYFEVGSAELSPKFRNALINTLPLKIRALIDQYHVDIVEVVGHTDEQPIAARPSNLDVGLGAVLNNSALISSLTPSDNAGLGLARAVSVVGVLRQNAALAGYKILPLSGAQLIDLDETLETGRKPGNIRERRRIEIRLRKSTAREAAKIERSN